MGRQVIFRTQEQPLSGRNQTILQGNPSRGEYNRICSTGQPLTGRTLPYILHGATPHGEENLASVQRNNLLKRIQFRCCFLEAALLRGNIVMGYSLRQPSNEGNACYDGFLGHPRKRGEHAACTPFQMHPQWGHESLHLQTGHPSLGEYKTDTRSPSSIEPPPRMWGR